MSECIGPNACLNCGGEYGEHRDGCYHLEPPPPEPIEVIRLMVHLWLSKQGQDRCWYYPEIFNQIADVLGIERPKATLPPRCEFEAGCKRYQNEHFGTTEFGGRGSPE